MEAISKYMVNSLGIKALIITLLVSSAFAGVRNKQIWDHHETLDRKGKYHLYWSADKNIVTFQVEVDTQGWVGFGLSPDGGFEDSDIVIGGVNKDKKYFRGYHVDKGGQLQIDTKKWAMISVAEEKGRVILKFRTKLDSCNPESWMIPGETHNLLYAYSDEDFPSPGKIRVNKEIWTVTKLNLLQPRVNEIDMPKDVKYFDLRMDNFTLPGNRGTFYGCKVIKGHQLQRKHHIIKMSPFVRPRNEEYVHHLFVSSCTVRNNAEGEQMVSRGVVDCMSETSGLPTAFANCFTIIFGWGRGGGSFSFPTKAGTPIGENPDEFYLIQIHYDNPSFLNARKIKFRHFRNNIELPPITIDSHFDHHFQKFTYLERDVVILPGDHLTAECTYDSSSRNVTTFARGGSSDEMCDVGIFYYPLVAFVVAQSDINVALIAGLTGLDLTGRGSMEDISLYVRHLLNYDWSQEHMCTIQNAQRFSLQNTICKMNDSQIISVPPIGYPEKVKVYRIPSVCSKPNIKGEESRFHYLNGCSRDI